MKKCHIINSYQYPYNMGLSLATAVLIAGCAGVSPPLEQMAVSRVAVKNASSAGGNEFAPLPLRSAMDKMDSAERAMTEENYTLARRLAEQAQVDAQLASVTARSVKAQKAVGALQEDNRVLRQEIDRSAQ